jgi:hypothetical protein
VLAALAAAAARLDRADVPWRLAGGTGRLLLGLPGRPSDVDIEVAADDAARAANALGLPAPTPTEGGGWSSLRSKGALAGVELDLSGSLRVEGPGGLLRADDADGVTMRFGGGTVRVEAPGESLARAVVSGDAAREQRARDQLPAQPAAALAYAELRIAAAASAAR